MRSLEYAVRRQQGRKYPRYLGLLISAACTAWIDLALAQSDGGLINEGPPLFLRSAQSLSTAVEPPSVRVSEAASTPGMLGLRMTRKLSLAAAATPADGDRPAVSAPAISTMAIIEEPENPVPFEAVRPGPSSTVAKAAAPRPDNLPDLTAIMGWSIPPIRWGGNAISTYGLNESSDGGKTFNETQGLNLHASSYIYQPWYAQVNGDLGLLSGSFEQNGNNSTATSASRSTSVTYGGNLSLFPQSRFPFQAYVQSSDSRANANATSVQYTSTRIGARQNYRPEVGPDNYSVSADRSIVSSSNVRSVVDALQGSYATIIADHNLNANARYSRNIGDVGGQGSNLFSLIGTHSWHPSEEFSIASSANFTNNEIRMLNGSGLSINNSQILQAGSSVTWLPDPDLPLMVSGGGNFLNINTETEAAKARLTNINGYANANYRFSNNLTAAGGLTMTENQSNGTSLFSSGQNASISYSGNPLVFGKYSYNWGTGAGISNQMVSSGEADRSLSGQVQHSLLRNIALSEASAITLNASESFSLTNNSTLGQSSVITHAGGASWRLGLGERSQGMLSATVSDSMSTGNFSSHFRSLSAQGNVQTQLSSHSALTASLYFVLSQQLKAPQVTQTATTSPPPTLTTNGSSNTLNGSGQVSYTHRNPFDIADLLYTATFQANASQTNLRLISGDPNALAWQTSKVFQQNLDYRLGRLLFRATSSFATLNGKENASLFFTINREIGDY